MNNYISIILPVYNSAEVIKNCLDSLIRQTFTNFEAVFVIDGSPDNSDEIIESYHDSRFVVIKKENGGVSSARNCGLNYARGSYITFVDPDDTIQPDYLRVLYDNIIKYHADISFCKSTSAKNLNNCIKVIDPKEFDFMCDFHPYVWGSMFCRDILEGILFDEQLSIGEDSLFVAQAIMHSKKTVSVNLGLYNYMVYEESLSHGAFSDRRMDCLTCWIKIADLFSDDTIMHRSALAVLSRNCIWCVSLYYKNAVFRQKYYKYCIKKYRSLFKYNYKYCGFKKKIAGLLFYIFPLFYVKLKNKAVD